MSNVKNWVVIPAAGVGSRMQADRPKQYLPLLDKTIIEHTIGCFLNRDDIEAIVVVIAENDPYWSNLDISKNEKVILAPGGEERYASVMNGLKVLQDKAQANDWVLVHDAARPCLRASDIDELMTQLENDEVGGILAVPVRDTMKRANTIDEISNTIERKDLWHALTPQMFRYEKLYDALESSITNNLNATDESMALEHKKLTVKLVKGHYDNIKITHHDDLELAELYLKRMKVN